MGTNEPLRLAIAVDRDVTPVSGLVTTPDGPERPFAGWTELFAALQAAIAAEEDSPK
ncbi:MAG TPA: hypothetical protein VH817_07720 [Thermoleophilaceae bacterium]|jgi:hypothetical protein